MNNCYILISIIGLVLDLWGFIGIYKVKLKSIPTNSNNHPYYVSRMRDSENLETVSKEIMKEVNKGFVRVNQAHREQDRKTLKYFLLVIVGVAFQIISLGIYFYQS